MEKPLNLNIKRLAKLTWEYEDNEARVDMLEKQIKTCQEEIESRRNRMDNLIADIKKELHL